jgi:hypothetical protein
MADSCQKSMNRALTAGPNLGLAWKGNLIRPTCLANAIVVALSWDRSARFALNSCDDLEVPGYRFFDLRCPMLRVRADGLQALVEVAEVPGASLRRRGRASNKRTLGEHAARKLSRVIFSAACSMRVTFAGQFRVVGEIWRAMSVEAVNLRREIVGNMG